MSTPPEHPPSPLEMLRDKRALVDAATPLAATALKVAHHGSATSSTASFLAAVRPALAIVSVGARNPYGHPDAGTLARLAGVGARVYRTDRDGAVSVLLKRDALEVRAERLARPRYWRRV